MSLDLFRLYQGLDIANEASSSNANILQGILAPGGDAGIHDAAPIGSIYMRTDVETDNLQLYTKWSASFNSAQDWRVMATKEYVDAVALGLSWREPVKVIDNTLYANAAAFPITGTIDGVALTNGDRVLFGNVTVGTDENIFIWNSGTSSWVQDGNAETDGDSVLVKAGTNAETQWVYDGANWVQFGGASNAAELTYLRSFIGKTGPGAENPTYTSTNVVTQATSLETAIGALDAVQGNGAITNDTTDNVGTFYSITDDLTSSGGTLTITDIANQLNNAIGNRNYTNSVSTTNLVDGETTAQSIEKLNNNLIGVINQGDSFTYSNITGLNTIDTLPLVDATEVKWLVQYRSTGIPANRKAVEVHGLTNGTLVDHTTYAVIKTGATINAPITIAISGSDLILQINPATAMDVVVKRVGYSVF